MQKLVLLTFFLIRVFACHAQENFRIHFEDPRLYRVIGAKNLYSSIDNNYVFFGLSYSKYYLGAYPQVYLAKVTESGNLIWSSFFYSGYLPNLNSIGWFNFQSAPTSDNGFIVTGTIKDTLSDSLCVLLFKVNFDATVAWSKQFRYPNRDIHGDAVFETFDHGFAIFANIINTPTLPNEKVFIRTNSFGSILYAKKYFNASSPGLNYDDQGNINQAIVTGDSGYAFATTSGALVKLDSTGTIQWMTSNQFTLGSYPRITETRNHEFLASAIGNNSSIRITKIDSHGNLLWMKSLKTKFGNSSTATPIETRNGDFLISFFYYKDTISYTSVAGISVLDSLGQYKVTKSYNDNSVDSTYSMSVTSICETPDGEFLSIGSSSRGIFYMKLDNQLNNDCLTFDVLFDQEPSIIDTNWAYNYQTTNVSLSSKGADIEAVDSLNIIGSCPFVPDTSYYSKDQLVNIYPNPSADKITILLNHGSLHIISIYDAVSQLVYSVELNIKSNLTRYEIDLTAFSVGIYFIYIDTESKIISKKILKY